MQPRILNKHACGVPAGAVYVGRPSKWGNPFPLRHERDRDAICDAFERYLAARPELVEAAKRELRGRDLVCWCAPRRCHAETLRQVANS